VFPLKLKLALKSVLYIALLSGKSSLLTVTKYVHGFSSVDINKRVSIISSTGTSFIFWVSSLVGRISPIRWGLVSDGVLPPEIETNLK